MKRIVIITLISCLALFGTPTVWAGQAKPVMGKLCIHIKGFGNADGIAKIALVDSKKSFEGDTILKGFDCTIANNEVMQTVSLPYGEYAVKVFHDENGNGELDTRIFGIPVERYGFSNDARGAFGPPDYEDARFILDSPDKIVTINIR